VLRLLPEAGVRLATLGELEPAGRVELEAGSWGSGKDFHVWENDLLDESRDVQQRLLDLVDKLRPRERDEALDQLCREAFLVMASDWAFCVTHDTAADYARSRHAAHRDRFRDLAHALESRHLDRALALAKRYRALDGVFGHLDARVTIRPR
jgi:1,4-alpha-glucan branching enzyme